MIACVYEAEQAFVTALRTKLPAAPSPIAAMRRMASACRCAGGCCKKLRQIWVDGGDRGKLLDWVVDHCWFVLQPVLRSDDMKGFVVLPRPCLRKREKHRTMLSWVAPALGACSAIAGSWEVPFLRKSRAVSTLG
jgi:hypothetical protein